MSAHGAPLPIDDLPGSDLVIEGLADLRDGRDSTSAALVQMAAPRLRDIGFDIPQRRTAEPASHHLYDLLATSDPAGAHSRYRALIGRMVKFARAAESRRRWSDSNS
jgi:hypothetical protein